MSENNRRLRQFGAPPDEVSNLVAFIIAFVLILVVAGLLYFAIATVLPGV